MFTFILRRLSYFIPIGLMVAGLTGLMVHLVPGDPVDAMLGDYASHEEKEILREKLGLKEPILWQLAHFYRTLFKGSLGQSLLSDRSVADLILERLPATVTLTFSALAVALLIALPLGILSAYRSRSWIDHASISFAMLGISIPNFWLGPLFILFFALYLGILPVSGKESWMSYVLPSLTMGIALAAIIARMARNTILECLKEDYVRTALSKGNHPLVALLKHVLRNASLPVITIVGLQFGTLLTGAVITERIFDWPGIGSLMLEALTSRDYPIVQGCVLFFAFAYLFANLLTDVLYSLMDPRIKLGKERS